MGVNLGVDISGKTRMVSYVGQVSPSMVEHNLLLLSSRRSELRRPPPSPFSDLVQPRGLGQRSVVSAHGVSLAPIPADRVSEMTKNDTRAASSPRAKASGRSSRTRPVEILETREVLALVTACSSRAPTGIRNRALLLMLWRAGLRISEALDLKPRDLGRAQGSVQILNGKGGKARTVGLDPMAFAVIDRWLDVRGKLTIHASAPLFCTLHGQAMIPSYVRALLPRLARKAGLLKRVHAHGLRHTFAAELAREGVPVNQIQKQLGHSSLAVTSRYLDHISPAELLETIASRPVPAEAVQLLGE